MVKSLVVEDINNVGKETFEYGEDNWEKSRWDKRWEVIYWGINPTKEEVVITVGKTFSLEEEFLSGGFIEDSSGFWAQW